MQRTMSLFFLCGVALLAGCSSVIVPAEGYRWPSTEREQR